MMGKSILLVLLPIISVSFSSAYEDCPPEPDSLKGSILYATDDYFAVAENLLEDEDPISNSDYTPFGKWMDGWESRRKRIPGHDYTIIALDKPSIIHRFLVNTGFFTGNFAPHFSIQAARLTKIVDDKFPPRNSEIGTAASEEALKKMAALRTEKWKTIVPISELKSGRSGTRISCHEVNSTEIWTHLRLNMFPDGGIARLRMYGETSEKWNATGSTELIDLIEAKNGGVAEGSSDNHYGEPPRLIKGGVAPSMNDGWESARQLNRPRIIRTGPSGLLEWGVNDWVLFRLGKPGIVETVVVDTTHYGGNSPYSAEVVGAVIRGNESAIDWQDWMTVLPLQVLSPNKRNVYEYEKIENNGPFTHVKLIIAPDGGLSRFKVLGYVQNEL